MHAIFGINPYICRYARAHKAATMTETTRKKGIIGKIAAYGIPLVVSVGLCYVLFTSIDFAEMAAIVREQCRPEWLALALSISILSHVARAARWQLQLDALGLRCGLWELTLSIFGTYAVNLVFPRLGEVWRTTYISRRSGAPFSEVFGSMVAERLVDMCTVLLILIGTFLLASGHMIEYLQGSAGALGELAGMLGSPWMWALFAVFFIGGWIYVARSRSALAAKVRDAVGGLWHGFAVLATMPGRGRWLVLTAVIWSCYFVQLYVAFYAFPFTAALASGPGGTLAVLVTYVLSSVAMGVPSNGGIGPWQWAVIFAPGSYGIGRAEAGAFANMVLGTQTLLLIALGILTFACILWQNKKLKIKN